MHFKIILYVREFVEEVVYGDFGSEIYEYTIPVATFKSFRGFEECNDATDIQVHKFTDLNIIFDEGSNNLTSADIRMMIGACYFFKFVNVQ